MSRIDWDNPPSQRRVHDFIGQHLVFDLVVATASLFVARLLWRAMHGGMDISARGVREFFVHSPTASPFLIWGVLVVSLLAALYALIDAALVVSRLLKRPHDADNEAGQGTASAPKIGGKDSTQQDTDRHASLPDSTQEST